jgi:hypothetical protein
METKKSKRREEGASMTSRLNVRESASKIAAEGCAIAAAPTGMVETMKIKPTGKIPDLP